MPRRSRGAYLYLRRDKRESDPTWVIRDSGREIRTGCSQSASQEAERELALYIAEKYNPPTREKQLAKLRIADLINIYLTERTPHVARPDFLLTTATPILDWWGTKCLDTVNAKACQDYVTWRCKKGVSDQTARHDLKTLRAAIRYYHANYGPLPAVPVVTLPSKAPQKEDYFLTRKQVADRIRAARKSTKTKHVARALLIGVYTGTRPGAMLRLQWLPSTHAGWFDLESETLHRRGSGVSETRKRATKARIHARLLPHLKRWRAADLAIGIPHCIHYVGKPIAKMRKSWGSVARKAGHSEKDGPHICRHTAVTWLLQRGVSYAETAGYVGMSARTIEDVYGHHSPLFQENAAGVTGGITGGRRK